MQNQNVCLFSFVEYLVNKNQTKCKDKYKDNFLSMFYHCFVGLTFYSKTIKYTVQKVNNMF